MIAEGNCHPTAFTENVTSLMDNVHTKNIIMNKKIVLRYQSRLNSQRTGKQNKTAARYLRSVKAKNGKYQNLSNTSLGS